MVLHDFQGVRSLRASTLPSQVAVLIQPNHKRPHGTKPKYQATPTASHVSDAILNLPAFEILQLNGDTRVNPGKTSIIAQQAHTTVKKIVNSSFNPPDFEVCYEVIKIQNLS